VAGLLLLTHDQMNGDCCIDAVDLTKQLNNVLTSIELAENSNNQVSFPDVESLCSKPHIMPALCIKFIDNNL